MEEEVEAMLKVDDTALILIDVQGKLARIIHQSEVLLAKLTSLIKGAQLLDIPILWLQQYPKGLGLTAGEILPLLEETSTPIDKMEFSACRNEDFREALAKLNKHTYLVAGI